MTDYNVEEILSLYEDELNKSEVARIYCERNNIPFSDSVRKRISRLINKNEDVPEAKKAKVKSAPVKTVDEEEFFMPSAWDADLNRFLSIEEYCEKYNLDLDSLERYNLVAHVGSHMIYNVRFKPTLKEVTGITEEYLEELITRLAQPVPQVDVPEVSIHQTSWVDRLVYTDVHIGMDVNGAGDSDPLYEGAWDKEALMERLDIMGDHVFRYRRSRSLYIDDLGDFLDGLDGETTRKGHKLPQNMSNKEAFETAIEFKVKLVESLLMGYHTIVCNNIWDDNHSGSFSYFANSAVKHILEQKYPDRVKVNNLSRFINHYSIGKHTFVISHGKDSQNLKFGFKPQLDVKQAEKIDQYCKEYKLYNGNHIEFSKGDSHQGIFDDTTSNDFSYYSYPAFSPPSNWVKTNFKNSKSGFIFYNIDQDSHIKIKIPYYF